MDSCAIYEELILDRCLSVAKDRRNQWDKSQLPTSDESKHGIRGSISLCDLGGRDYDLYRFMMDGLQESIQKAIIASVFEVARSRGIGFGQLSLAAIMARQYVAVDPSGRKRSFGPIPYCDPEPVPGISLTVENTSTLYIFIEPNIADYLPRGIENALLKSPGIDRIKYVMLAEKGIPSPSLNWFDNERDEVQGYKAYTLEEFFDDIFGHNEWKKLESYLNELREQVADYCGISIVKALRPNSLRHFSLSIDVESQKLSSELNITENQKELLDARFATGRAYAALTGTCDFAKSFKTAEWLYKSLKEACHSDVSGKPAMVDLTPITASYFKSIEQYIYDFMAIHTSEHDQTDRKLFVGGNRSTLLPSKDYRRSTRPLPITDGYIEITSSLLSPAFKETLNLGLLTRFFGSKDRHGRLYENCTDLLVDTAKDCGAYELIVDTLARVTTLRNGYFHKANLYEWDKVDEVRDIVRLAFYLLLGAYEMTHEDEVELGFDTSMLLDGTYSLCEYINHRALTVDRFRSDGSLVLPLFYCEEVAVPLFAMTSDSATEYDENGVAAYDGIHFRKFRPKVEGQDDDTVFFSLANLPKRISEGYLEMTSPDLLRNKQSGPLKTIFEDGQFLGSLEL